MPGQLLEQYTDSDSFGLFLLFIKYLISVELKLTSDFIVNWYAIISSIISLFWLS